VHLTLKFLGKTDKKDQIIEVLNKIPKIKPFDLNFNGLGKFGRGADIRVVWVGIKPSENLKILFDKIESHLEPIGFPREERKFSPHITLARNRQGQIPENLLNRIEDLSDQRIAAQEITSFQLYKSDLTISGPIYTTLSDFHLSQSS